MSKGNARGMQDDVISREQVIEALGELATFTEDWSCHTWMYTDDVYNAIKQLPPIQPKKGRWISADAIFGGVPFYCSECGENTWDTVMGKPRWNYCPMCGADMRGERDG